MANSPKSSSFNHENDVGATSNSSIGPSPLSPKPVSNHTVTEQPHPTINEALSINGGDSVNEFSQLGLNHRANELRTRSLVTHGRADSLSLRNDHLAWLGGEILGAPSSTRGRPLFTPIDFGDNKDFVRSQLLHPPLNLNGVIFTSCKNHDDKNAREKMKKYGPDASSLSSSSSSSSSSSPKECGGDCTMTAAAEEMLRTQLLHASSIRDRLMSNRRYGGFNFEDPILGNRSLSIPKSRMDHNSFTNTHHFHNIFNYPTFLSGDTTTPTHSSSQTQPSHKRLIITDLDVDEPTNNARGKKTLAPSPFRFRIHNFPTETSGPSMENCLQKKIDLGGIMNEPKRNNHSGPNRVVIDLDDSDDGDNENYDGRIHSLPYKRNGPYTCPKCKGMYPTSQHFAAHVTASHYKYETKAQRMKRQMAKIRRRTLKLQQVKDGLTIVPVSSEEAAGPGAGTSSAERFANGGGGPAFKVKIEGDVQDREPDAPPGFGVVKIKMEPSAS